MQLRRDLYPHYTFHAGMYKQEFIEFYSCIKLLYHMKCQEKEINTDRNQSKKVLINKPVSITIYKEVYIMSVIITSAIVALVIAAYEKSGLRKTSHITHEMVTGSNTQVTVLRQPR